MFANEIWPLLTNDFTRFMVLLTNDFTRFMVIMAEFKSNLKSNTVKFFNWYLIVRKEYEQKHKRRENLCCERHFRLSISVRIWLRTSFCFTGKISFMAVDGFQ
jgi:hypothetical protein